MNGWLIAGIVIGVIAALVGLVAMFIYAWNLCEKDKFEDKDRRYLLGEYPSQDDENKYVFIGRETYIASLILGIIAGIYSIIKSFIIYLPDFWKETSEANIFFILILVGLILVSAVQAIVHYDDKKIAAKKIGLGIYYCVFGALVGLLLSVIIFIAFIVSGVSSAIKEGSRGDYKLEDGTIVKAEKDIFGFETGKFTEKGLLPGGRQYERTDNDHVIEI
jgi:hypothetical protein